MNFATLGDRNFERGGDTQYASNRVHLDYFGVPYEPGSTIPFDANANTTYSDEDYLERCWNSQWLTPLS